MKKILIIASVIFLGCSSPDFKDAGKKLDTLDKKITETQEQTRSIVPQTKDTSDILKNLDEIKKLSSGLRSDINKYEPAYNEAVKKLHEKEIENLYLWLFVFIEILLIAVYFGAKFYIKMALPGNSQLISILSKLPIK